MDLNEINAILDNALATNAPNVAPTPMAGVAAPLTGMAYESKLADILNRRAALQSQIAGSEQAISARETLGGLASGIGQGTTLGWGDEILAGLWSLVPGNTYEQTLAEQQAELAKAREVAPVATMTGEIGSALLTPFAAARSVKALGGLRGLAGEVVTGAPRLAGQTALQTIVPSAVAGSLYSAGAAEPGDRLSNALFGLGLGGAVPATLGAGAAALGRGAQALARRGLTPEAEIGAAFIESGLSPTDVARQVKDIRGTTMEGAYTSAQVTQNPLIATLERNLPTNIPSEEPRLAVQKIQVPKQAREVALKNLDPATTSRTPMPIAADLNAGDTGTAIKKKVAEAAESTKEAANALYKNVTHVTLTQEEADALRNASETARSTYFGKPTKYVAQEGTTTKLGIREDEPDDIANTLTSLQRQETYSTDQLIIKRGVLDDYIQKYSNEGQQQAVATLTAVRDHITGILKRRAGKEWERANEAYREYAERFVNGVFPNVGAKTSKILPQDVVDEITSNQEAAKQFVAQVGRGSDALKEAQRQIVSDLRKAFGRKSEAASVAVINRLEDNADTYKIIFQDNENAASVIDEMVAYTRASRNAAELANAVGNSTTANKLFPLVQDFLAGAPTKSEQARRELGNYLRSTAIGLGGAALAGPIGGTLAGVLTGLSSGVASLQARKLLQAKRIDELGTQLAEMLINPVALVKGLKAGEAVLPRLKQGLQISEQAAAVPGKVSGAATRGMMGLTGDASESPQSVTATAPEVPSITVDDIRRQMQELLGPAEAQAAVMPPEEVVKQRMIQRFPKASPEVREVLSGADELLQAIAYVESRGNPKAKSPKGAIGLYQFVPGTAKSLGIDPNDPAQSLDGAKRFMDKLIGRFDNEQLALAAYNWGEGNVASAMKQVARAKKIDDWRKVPWSTLSEFKPRGSKDYLVPAETRQYVPKVLALRESYITRG